MGQFNILLTNDDGYAAPGLIGLKRVAEKFGTVFVAAPDKQYSGCGHQTTMNEEIKFREIDPRTLVIDGTPADCTRIGLHHFPNIHWVFSGINDGGNLGVDAYMSGTVASAREAAFLRIRSLAISQYRKSNTISWERAAKMAEEVIGQVILRDLPEYSFWNINLPNVEPNAGEPAVLETPCDRIAMPLTYRKTDLGCIYAGSYHDRPRTAGSDVDVCFRGQISISKIRV